MEAIFTIGNFYIDIISLIALIILLIGAIKGAFKGFALSIVEMSKIVVIYLGIKFLSEPLSKVLIETEWGINWINKLGSQIEGMGSIFAEPFTGGEQLPQIIELLKSLNIPNIIIDPLSELIVSLNNSGGLSLGMQISQGIFQYVFIAISAGIVLVVISIIYFFVLRFAKKINKNKVLGGINRLLGFIFGLVINYFTIDIIIYLISLVALGSPDLSQKIATTIYLNNEEIFTIAKFIYNNNITKLIIDSLL